MRSVHDVLCRVISNERAADGLHVMRLEAPELASSVGCGQFIHMEMPTLQSHILRRPFSVYDAHPESGTIDILYQVVGTGSASMVGWENGFMVRAIGPIGSTWTPPQDARRVLLVGGGVGAAPLLLLCKMLLGRGVDVKVVLGASTADALVCKGRYSDVCGCEPDCSTDDGTYGAKGFATALVEAALKDAMEDEPFDYAAICGPEPLMKAASAMTLEVGIPTQVSMERRMACGIGACLSCVVDTTEGKRRACVDGPIFDAKEVVW